MKITTHNQSKKIVFVFLLLFTLLTSLYMAFADSTTAATMYVWVCDDNTGCAYPGILSTSGSSINTLNYNVGSASNPHSTVCQYEGAKYVRSSSSCETGGTTYSTPSYISIYDVNWDGDQNDCECYGKTWFTNLGSTTNSALDWCCGDDTTSDDWATYSGSLTTSTSLNCRRCLDGTDQSTSALYGNGNLQGSGTSRTCYYGNIICSSASASHGTSAVVYGWGWYDGSLTTSTSLNCRSGVGSCSDGSYTNDDISILYGNGYTTGSRTADQSLLCYHGDITCSDGSEANGASSTQYGNGYISGNTCYHGDITCSDGSAVNGASCTLDPTDICGEGVACQDCSPYQRLSTTECRTTCSSDSHCISTYYCSGSSCVPKKADGQSCSGDNQCLNNDCNTQPDNTWTCTPIDDECADQSGVGIDIGYYDCYNNDRYYCARESVYSGTDGWDVNEDCANSCQHDGDGTYSDKEATCSGTVCDTYSSCNVEYACSGSSSKEAGDDCATSCSDNDDDYCAEGYTCEVTSCVAKSAALKPCDENSDCLSNHCIIDYDGIGKFCACTTTDCVYDEDGMGDADYCILKSYELCVGDGYKRCNAGNWWSSSTSCPTIYQTGGDTYYCQYDDVSCVSGTSGGCANDGWTNFNEGLVCSQTDYCEGDGYYDGKQCNSGNCDTGYSYTNCSDVDCKDDLDNTFSDRIDSTCSGISCTSNPYVDCNIGYACEGSISKADGTACSVSCSDNDDDYCAYGYTCEVTSCVPKKADGNTCDEDNDCQSNYCDNDGVGAVDDYKCFTPLGGRYDNQDAKCEESADPSLNDNADEYRNECRESTGFVTEACTYSSEADNDNDTCNCIVAPDHWAIGGEIAQTACCGDDSGEYYITTTIGETTYEACCDNPDDQTNELSACMEETCTDLNLKCCLTEGGKGEPYPGLDSTCPIGYECWEVCAPLLQECATSNDCNPTENECCYKPYPYSNGTCISDLTEAGKSTQDAEYDACLCMVSQGNLNSTCINTDDTPCWDVVSGKCCGNDQTETWGTEYQSRDFLEKLLVTGYCEDGAWKSRENILLTFYDMWVQK